MSESPHSQELTRDLKENFLTRNLGKHFLTRNLRKCFEKAGADADLHDLSGDLSDGLLDFGPLPVFEHTGKKNDPRAILAAWTALEVLSPSKSYKRPEDMLSGNESSVALLKSKSRRGMPCMPWEVGVCNKPGKRLYFEVFLGAILLDKATDELVKAFGADEEREKHDGKHVPIGSVLIDNNGFVLKKDGVAVSSFAWALKQALELKLGSLSEWSRIEQQICGRLDKMFRDDEGNSLPINREVLNKAFRWLVDQFGLPDDLVKQPTFAIKSFHPSETPPKPSLLNSFYLKDLKTASDLIASNAAGLGLNRYLGCSRPTDKIDLLSPVSCIEKYVTPDRMPLVRWPSSGGRPLVLLQQAAVNVARSEELSDGGGLMGVNGPPGTGKTTLLRDVVVGCILDRATAMAELQKLEDAFSKTNETLAVGSGFSRFQFYRLHDSLKGHEIVVASSNNNAVENVSKELPLKEANGRHDEMAYFRTISDLIANVKQTDNNEAEDGENGEPVETWGLISAVLGKYKNRESFMKAFWWDKDRGFQTYLNAASKTNRRKNVIGKEIPSVVVHEKPASPEEAMAAWQQAREDFLAQKKAVEAELKTIDAMRCQLLEYRDADTKLQKLEASRQNLEDKVFDVKQEERALRNKQITVKRRADHDRSILDRHLAGRPGFFAKLLDTASWHMWNTERQRLSDAFEQATREVQSIGGEVQAAAFRSEQAESELQKLEESVEHAQGKVTDLYEQTIGARERLGERIIDDILFKQSHETIQLTAPWLPDDVHQKRENLFAAALALHKAFIDASADYLYHNLSLLMSTNMASGVFQSDAKRDLLPDLWASFFMVVPSVSTTFASIASMFGDLPSQSIGWLLIDEAGQAIPQAAVGAIMRSKRTLVVGDPMQVPPVVSLPSKLNDEICKLFNVEQDKWSAPSASVQTLADSASRFRSSFETDGGNREVGLPLLVHRRCQNPMFDVSNTISYARKMVHAAGLRQNGVIGAVLGQSRWIDIQGQAETKGHVESKWCAAEGDEVIRLFQALADKGVRNPDLFVITPFKIVAQEMRRRLEKETDLLRALGVKVKNWPQDRIGTVHTFQGREADTVILLLGAPHASQDGARRWASNPPNIINVAVSRAKQNFYVVGSQREWGATGTSVQVLQRALV